MSEPKTKTGFSNAQTLLFIVILSVVCALILSLLASILEKPKELAKDLDRSKQMLIAAKILDHGGFFILSDGKGGFSKAKLNENGILVPTDKQIIPSKEQLIAVYKKRLIPKLVDAQGKLFTFEEAHISAEDYLSKYKKTGYYKEPFKLLYALLPNQPDENKQALDGYVFPINGFGLWDAIYGYLAIKLDGNTIIGTSWYDQKETPGLGANIAEEPWQSLFPGKKIFQASPNGTTDFKTAPLGIAVVKGKVSEVLGESPKALSAVDGMAGATLTGNGVTEAFRDSLSPYRPFLIQLHQAFEKSSKEEPKQP